MFGVARRLGVSDRSVSRFLIGAMALGFVLVIAAVAAAVWMAGQTRRYSDAVEHTYQVEVAISQAQLLEEQAETTRRGYLLSLTPLYRDAYEQIAAQRGPALDRLQRLTRDNPRQQLAIAGYRSRAEQLATARDRSIMLARSGQVETARSLFARETSFRPMQDLRETARGMLAEERRLLTVRDAEQQRSRRIFYGVIGLAALLVAALAVMTTVTLIRFARDLRATRDEAQRLNETLEFQVADRTADLTRANEEIQRFAYIVSHDLRSPLVNVMGFTSELEAAVKPLAELVERAEATAPEVVTEDARLAAREDLPEAIGFIRTSTQKMDRLINAILKLSREGRRVIAPEPLDVAEIAENAVASMKQLIDGRGATVEVQHPLPHVVSDRVAVEQILSNLIENATKYLQPGRPGRISVVGFRERGRVVVSVVDNGRGIAPSDHERIFDLFRRSGTQDQPGEGIGLAHVRAAAYRLGGTIDVESQLGEGSTFRLSLPATFEGPRA